MSVSHEKSLAEEFNECEKLINDVEACSISVKDAQIHLQKIMKTLESLTISVTKLALFSSNESYEELSSSSLCFLLLPVYLGLCHQWKITQDALDKIEELKLAKVYFRDYLKRLWEYGIEEGELPWEDSEERIPTRPRHKSAEEKRQDKLNRYRKQMELESLIGTLKRQREINEEDESMMRDLVVAQLRYWFYRALTELDSIECELPMLEHRRKMQKESGESSGQSRKEVHRGPPRKPFIITRDAAQKAVFGLGYPSVPVMTVDEWYDQQEKSGRFGNKGAEEASTSEERRLSDSECEDEGREEERRERAMRWDEYKDSHRRGWGNTHNKG